MDRVVTRSSNEGKRPAPLLPSITHYLIYEYSPRLRMPPAKSAKNATERPPNTDQLPPIKNTARLPPWTL